MDKIPPEDNVFKIVAPSNTKPKEDNLPQFNYIVECVDGIVDNVFGFPVFSPQYVMVMRELDDGVTVPCYMRPIDRISSFILDEDEDIELPF